MAEIAYILPVHNEAAFLRRNVERLRERLAPLRDPAIVVVENGSRDDSWSVCKELASESGVRVLAFREPAAGIGYAYDRGLREAIAAFGEANNRWAVLTAADLPFGFSDLDGAADPMSRNVRILMGSKAHRDSSGPRDPRRHGMSLVYRAARRLLLGMRVGDSQGSLFLRLDLAARLLPLVRSRDFFYTTELCFFAEREGEAIMELPIAIEAEQRKSTVKPFRDGAKMFGQLFDLRRRV